MKLTRVAFTIYCTLLLFAATMNIAADPADQPFKDMSAILCLGCALFGLFLKKRHLLLGIPAFALIQGGIAFSQSNNFYAALGGLAGLMIPVLLWYVIDRDLRNASTQKNIDERLSA